MTLAIASALLAGAILFVAVPGLRHRLAGGARGARDCLQRAVVPAYFNPGPYWRELLGHDARALTLIVNPSNGPGTSVDGRYRRWVDAARKDGATLLGYVDTKYRHVPLRQAERQVREYGSWYGVTSIFFDDVSSGAGGVGYYRTVSNYVRTRSHGAQVMLNPGDYPSRVYGTLGDELVVAEYGYAQFRRARPPAWVRKQSPHELVAIISGVPRARLATVLELTTRRRMQGVYVTNVSPTANDLYEQLPAYWRAEIRSVANSCS